MFDRLFNSENPFWQAMGRLFDLTELNLLWLLCSIPLVTIGASTTAFYYATLALVRNEESTPLKDFFRSFRRNLKQGTLMGLLLAVSGGFFALDVYLARQAGPGIFTFFMVLFAVLFLLWACITLYAFPLLAKFDNTIGKTLLLAFTLSLRHLPQTALMLAAAGIALWLCHLSPVFVFFIFGVLLEFQSPFLAVIFKPYLAKDDEETQDEGENL